MSIFTVIGYLSEMNELKIIVVMQVLAAIFGLWSYWYNSSLYPSVAMAVWGACSTLVMAIVWLFGDSGLLRLYGVKGSILFMIFVNAVFMIITFIDGRSGN